MLLHVDRLRTAPCIDQSVCWYNRELSRAEVKPSICGNARDVNWIGDFLVVAWLAKGPVRGLEHFDGET